MLVPRIIVWMMLILMDTKSGRWNYFFIFEFIQHQHTYNWRFLVWFGIPRGAISFLILVEYLIFILHKFDLILNSNLIIDFWGFFHRLVIEDFFMEINGGEVIRFCMKRWGINVTFFLGGLKPITFEIYQTKNKYIRRTFW